MTLNSIENTARLLIICPDKPGIISMVSTFLYRYGANITDFDQHATDPEGGTFFMRLEFQTSGLTCSVEQFREHFLAEVAGPYKMEWRLTLASEKKRMAIMVRSEERRVGKECRCRWVREAWCESD